MLVFGDKAERVDVGLRLEEIIRAATAALEAPSPERGWLTSEVFIDIAALAQGLIDADFAVCGEDRDTPCRQAATTLVLVAADLVTGRAEIDTLRHAIDGLVALDLPISVECKRAEGYAFYALYPESYLAAAQALPGSPGVVVGIRSIGLGLAALIAVASGAADLFSVRPIGHPFHRKLSLAQDYRNRMQAARPPIAIADEGPGFSGSSFSAVIDEFRAANLPEQEIHLFPSHLGLPGGEVVSESLARWGRLPRHVISFDEMFLGERPPAPHLESWFADITGPLIAPLIDLSGGSWRKLRPETADLPAYLQQERRKFLLITPDGKFLLKFVGLGRSGREAADRAERLASGGFAPETLAFRNGFLLTRWVAAEPLEQSSLSRDALVAHLAAYLGFRARQLSAGSAPGAELPELAEMLLINGQEALGSEAISALHQFGDHRPQHGGYRVMTDNRLHAWEWLVTPDGRVLKTDGVDHCAAHDLIGCQDIAWDIAGATIELALTPEERAELIGRLGRVEHVEVEPMLLAFFDSCYAAFQLGYYTMAAAALANMPEERPRLEARAAIYREALARRL